MAAIAASTDPRKVSPISFAATRFSSGTGSGPHWCSHSGGRADDLAESLAKLKTINPDFVMSSGFVGEVSYREVTRDEWTAVLDDRIAAIGARS